MALEPDTNAPPPEAMTAGECPKRSNTSSFHFPKTRLAKPGKNLWDAHLLFFLNVGVHIDKFSAVAFCQSTSDGTFSASHEAA